MDNYIKEEAGGVRVQAPMSDRSATAELASEFSLPDYQPEIKRLLRLRAILHPADQYVGGGSVELSGLVDYCILYSGNDGALYCVTQTEEYQISVPMDAAPEFSLSDGVLCDAEVTPELVTGRVGAPRRISVKCRIKARARVYGNRILDNPVRAFSGEPIESLCGSADCAQIFLGMGEPLQLADEITCDTKGTDLRVICAEGQVLVSEATAGSGTVGCRGEVCIKLLCCTDAEGATPTPQWRRIPFTQIVPVDGVEVNCDCSADGVCTDLEITVEEGRILCETTLRLRARAQRNETVSFVRDAYSTAHEWESQDQVYTFPRALRCVNGNFSLNSSLSLEEAGIRKEQSVLDVTLFPTVTSIGEERGRLCLLGRCRCHVILLGEEDVGAQEFELPFRYEMEGTAEQAPTDWDARVQPLTCRARVDGGAIHVDAELAVSAAVRGESSFRALCDARLGDEVLQSGSAYTVCYPSSEDTLWSVAKRYYRSISGISQVNALSGASAADASDSLAGITYLLV